MTEVPRTTYSELLLVRARMKTRRYNKGSSGYSNFMFKVKNKLVPKYLSDLFTVNIINFNSRAAKFILPRFRTFRFGKHSH